MAQKLWDVRRRNCGTGRRNYGILHFWLDNPDYTYRSQGQWLWHDTTAQFTAGWAVLGNQAVVVARGHRTALRRGW
jgi:hypothetical protein